MGSLIGKVRFAVAALLCVSGLYAQSGTCSGMGVGPLASLNGFVPFSSSSLWNTDISNSPVDPNSASYINYIGATAPLFPSFGSGQYDGQSIGIPYQVEAASQPAVPVERGEYANESDPGPIPIPLNALIEGYPQPGTGDRHVLVLDNGNCWLYEFFYAHRASGVWSADSVAIWDMTIDEQRPYTWTSADAAGLPVFAGLARYDEVAAGAINHALRFTLPTTQEAFTPPASHWASNVTDPTAPPMGMRLRLKASFDISGFSASNQVILKALQKYGMIAADNGAALFVAGMPDPSWNNSDLNLLKGVTASDFDVVLMTQIYTPLNVPTGPSPTIASFTASALTISAGTPVTLTWNESNVSYTIIAPQVGPVRGSSVVVTPAKTITYTLYATNRYGRSTASVTVTVQ